MELHEIVYQLLFDHQCVIVPELGGFISRESPAGINPYANEIKPETKSVFFNEHMLFDDGLLLNYVCEQKKWSFEKAKEEVAKRVGALKQTLTDKNRVAFGDLGELIKNKEGRIILMVNKDLNLNLSTFGLETISIKPLAKKETAVEVVEELNTPEKVVELEVVKKSSKSWLPAVAAVLLLGAFGAWFFTTQWSQSPENIADNSTLNKDQIAGFDDSDNNNAETDNVVPEDESDELVGNEVDLDEADNTYDEGETYPEEENYSEEEDSDDETVQNDEFPSDVVDNMATEDGNYFIVLGSFLQETNAERYSKILAGKGIETQLFKKENSSLYRLVFEKHQSFEEASERLNWVKSTLGTSATVFENID
jgi:cell division protein FtsN